jgi:queuine tRNA-ribosyltransferase
MYFSLASYHLMLQPGPDIIEQAGGIHRFMHRETGPIITDSGGFQIFSLAYGSVHADIGELNKEPQAELKRAAPKPGGESSVVKVTENGCIFRSYRDGTYVELTPESTVLAQKKYGSDIIIPLDELPPYNTTPERLKESVLLSHRWEERSLQEHLKNISNQAMYAVVHGGVDKELRQLSVDVLTAMPFDGYAVGGSLGSCHEELVDLLSFVIPKLPRAKPNHLLGIADERSISSAIPFGVDTFDSCFPTRLARHGTVLTANGKLHLKSNVCRTSFGKPICSTCSCSTCRRYDLAYLNHLQKAQEPLLWQLASIHNIHFMNTLMANYRAKIIANEV